MIPSEAVQAGTAGLVCLCRESRSNCRAASSQVGQTVYGKVIIEKGITAGETVVTDGQSRLYPGAKIDTSESSPDRFNGEIACTSHGFLSNVRS